MTKIVELKTLRGDFLLDLLSGSTIAIPSLLTRFHLYRIVPLTMNLTPLDDFIYILGKCY